MYEKTISHTESNDNSEMIVLMIRLEHTMVASWRCYSGKIKKKQEEQDCKSETTVCLHRFHQENHTQDPQQGRH